MNSMLSNRLLQSEDHNGQLTFKKFIKIFASPTAWATIIMTLVCWSAMDFMMPVLQPHIRTILPEASEATVTHTTGIMFVVYAISYGIATPLVGKACTMVGHKSNRPAMSFGSILIVICYFLMGPNEHVANLLGLAKFGKVEYLGGVYQTGVVFGILGLGVALIAVPSVEDLVQTAYSIGFPKKGIATVSVVCGFYNCILFGGEFIGPVLAGYFQEMTSAKMSNVDSVSTTYSLFAIVSMVASLFSMLVYFINWFIEKYKKNNKELKKAKSLTNQDDISFIKKNKKNSFRSNNVVLGPQSFTMSYSYQQ